MLIGNNGILTQAQRAKSITSISTEKEAIQFEVINEEMDKTLENKVENGIGKQLYSKTLENSNK